MANEKQVNVKVDDQTFKVLEECSKLDYDRGVAGVVRRLMKEYLPALKAELELQSKNLVLNETHSPYHAKPKPKPKAVVPKKLRN